MLKPPGQREARGKDGCPSRRRVATRLTAFALVGCLPVFADKARAAKGSMLIDDFSGTDLISARGAAWRGVSDRVMGGVSDVRIAREVVAGRAALRLTGTVSLENNGGFVQAALDLDPTGTPVDLSGFNGVRLTVRGNGEAYSLHLKTADTVRPWQSYRAGFTATDTWQTIDLPFSGFRPHRVDAPLDTSRVRRLGLVAIGRAFEADLAVAELLFYS